MSPSHRDDLDPAEVDLSARADELEKKADELQESAREVAPDTNRSKEQRDAEANEQLDRALKAPLETLSRVAKRS
jgi:hypothetical protein